jgi:hypothetical protein
MCNLLVPEWFNGFYAYLVFKSLSVIGQCLVNMNIPAKKKRGGGRTYRWTPKVK